MIPRTPSGVKTAVLAGGSARTDTVRVTDLRRLGPRDLVLCAGTLLGASFEELAGAARAGGFRGITLWPDVYRRAVAEGLSPRDMLSFLGDRDLVVSDLDPLLRWLPPSDGGAALASHAGEEEFYAIAGALGVGTLNAAPPLGGPWERETLIGSFAALCDRAAERGLRVTLEFLPWSDVPDVATAWEIVEGAGRANGDVCFDTWHWFRGARDLDALRTVPGGRVGAVQINDAPRAATGDLVAETVDARLLPGEGAIPLREILGVLREIGCQAPLGVEVFSRELRSLPPLEVGRRCGETARALLEGVPG
jgi:sugar phosphate isomerase/epimerase